VKSIEDDYAAPAGFESKADRRGREDRRRENEQRAAEERRRQQEEEARERAERMAVDDYWNGLTPGQQAELDAAALAQASPTMPEIQAGPLRRLGKEIVRNEYIRRLLKERACAPTDQQAPCPV